jgi:hypothetical protein
MLRHVKTWKSSLVLIGVVILSLAIQALDHSRAKKWKHIKRSYQAVVSREIM